MADGLPKICVGCGQDAEGLVLCEGGHAVNGSPPDLCGPVMSARELYEALDETQEQLCDLILKHEPTGPAPGVVYRATVERARKHLGLRGIMMDDVCLTLAQAVGFARAELTRVLRGVRSAKWHRHGGRNVCEVLLCGEDGAAFHAEVPEAPDE